MYYDYIINTHFLLSRFKFHPYCIMYNVNNNFWFTIELNVSYQKL